MLSGRTDKQKQALVEELTEAFVRTCGGKHDGVWGMIEEVEHAHRGVGGLVSTAG
ncbi:tautomerase family protein [Amycolatopsis samaneae]